MKKPMSDRMGPDPDDLWTEAGPEVGGAAGPPPLRQPAAAERTIPVIWCLVAVVVVGLLGIGAGHAMGGESGTGIVTSEGEGDRSSTSTDITIPATSAPFAAPAATEAEPSTAPPTTAEVGS